MKTQLRKDFIQDARKHVQHVMEKYPDLGCSSDELMWDYLAYKCAELQSELDTIKKTTNTKGELNE